MNQSEQKRKTRVTCAPSLASYLKEELEALGFEDFVDGQDGR